MENHPHLRRPAPGEAAVSGNAQPESIDSLKLRLADGFQRIDVARTRGEDVSAWEDFWIELLHRYEALCDDDRIAA